jgi:hypothetical protein
MILLEYQLIKIYKIVLIIYHKIGMGNEKIFFFLFMINICLYLFYFLIQHI